jgi:hypothetical protein
VPTLHGVLHHAKDHEVTQWSFPAKDARLPAGGVTGFETRVRNPPADATGISIAFAEGS